MSEKNTLWLLQATNVLILLLATAFPNTTYDRVIRFGVSVLALVMIIYLFVQIRKLKKK